jgi:hypothetical protein
MARPGYTVSTVSNKDKAGNMHMFLLQKLIAHIENGVLIFHMWWNKNLIELRLKYKIKLKYNLS